MKIMQEIRIKTKYKKAQNTNSVYTTATFYNYILRTKIKILHLYAKGASPISASPQQFENSRSYPDPTEQESSLS